MKLKEMFGKRKIKNAVIVMLIFAMTALVCSATRGEISVTVNNEIVNFDSEPIIENGRTLVPLRVIFEALNASVDWNDSTKTVTAVKGDKTIKLTIGKNDAYVNGEMSTLEAAPTIVKDRTLVPVRFVSEGLDCNVDWDDNTRTVKIYEKGFVIDRLRVHYLDVGQGDSEFVELPDGKTILIDGANKGDGVKIGDYINYLGHDKIDYLIATHPHADHIGGLEYIVNHFEVGAFYLPNVTTTSQTFINLLTAVDEKNIQTFEAKSGVKIENDLCNIEFLSPDGGDYKDLNDYSAVLKLTYGNADFLFMGDAEMYAENRINANVSADVIKIGHHGSSTSSGEEFLKNVNPKYAVISCGKGNSYGHPHKETIEKLNALGIKYFRTDEVGTITMDSGGESITVNKDYSVSTEDEFVDVPKTETGQIQQPSGQSVSSDTVYVTKSGKKYHAKSCTSLKKSKIEITLAEARLEYEPCSKCNPPR